MFKLIFWLIVLTLALSYFGISIQAIVTSPVGQENFIYLYTLLTQGAYWLWSIAIQHLPVLSSVPML